ncbi:hypothetical protein [Streptomyces sp. NPDC001843]|uniref:hypothetical protein n=1 Tax=Streptomyces sp. NPDC001843 TaxID=3364617 RepID=UPI00368142C5
MTDHEKHPTLKNKLSDSVDAITRSQARAVVLQAEGPDFSYGGDFRPWLDTDRTSLRADFDQVMAVVNRFEQLPIPVVAGVQGLCFRWACASRCSSQRPSAVTTNVHGVGGHAVGLQVWRWEFS